MNGTAKSLSMTRRIERLLGPSAAALLGAASAFFCFAMPAAIVSAGVGRLGLPPAVAESRLVLALVLGIGVAAATWYGFAALDRAARPRAIHLGAPEGEAAVAPVLRRADVHPDAPPRRPIFAGSDLGTPLDLIDPLPFNWDGPSHSVAPAAAPAIEYALFQPIDLLPIGQPSAELPAQEPVPVPAAEPVAADAPTTRADSPSAPSASSAPLPTLAAMMARLETGLARKALALTDAEANVTALKREIRPIGGTLRAAVDTLQQRTAARR